MKPARTKPMLYFYRSKKGIALILTLLIVSLLTAGALVFIKSVHLGALVAENAYEFKQAEIYAVAGVEAARTVLALDNNKYDSLGESWANFQDVAALSGGFFEEGGFTGSIQDLSGRFNVNSLIGKNGLVQNKNVNQFERLLGVMDMDAEVVPAVLDWLDPDDEPRTGGAESPYYSGLDEPYPVGNRPLDVFGQLALIKGVILENLYGGNEKPGLRSVACVYSDGKINVNTAGEKVLMSLDDGLTESVAKEIMARRVSEPFEKIDELKDISGMTPETFARIAGLVSVAGTHFLITVEGRYRDARSAVQAVVERSGSGVRILYYRAL